MTLIPAYGRDYKSKAEVIAAFEADKDFQIADISSPWDGRYCNRADLSGSGLKGVNIRYAKLTKVVVVKL